MFHERFPCLRISINWGELLVMCLKESLNYVDPLLQMVSVMRTSLVSGD